MDIGNVIMHRRMQSIFYVLTKKKETRKHLLNMKFGFLTITLEMTTLTKSYAESIYSFGSASVAVIGAISVLQFLSKEK